MSNYEGGLSFTDAAKAKLEEEGLQEADVRAVIGAAEESGEKMRNAEATLFVAKLKIEEKYVFVEYASAANGFEVVDTFALGSEVTGW